MYMYGKTIETSNIFAKIIGEDQTDDGCLISLIHENSTSHFLQKFHHKHRRLKLNAENQCEKKRIKTSLAPCSRECLLGDSAN